MPVVLRACLPFEFPYENPGKTCENRVATAAFKMKFPSPRQRANPTASHATISAALPGRARVAFCPAQKGEYS